jgi:hypothetical protein
MTHSPGHIRDQFEELVWALAQRKPAPTDYHGEDAMPPLALCGKLWNSTDITPSGAPFDDLDSMLEKIDAMPKRRTFGAYARGLSKLLKVAA